MQDLIDRQAAIDAFDGTKVDEEYCNEYDNGYNDGIDFAVSRLSVLPSAQQWTPCSERLPRQGEEVICQCRANMIMVLKLDADGDWYQDASHFYMGGFVIAWMPLPEPYKGEDNE